MYIDLRAFIDLKMISILKIHVKASYGTERVHHAIILSIDLKDNSQKRLFLHLKNGNIK